MKTSITKGLDEQDKREIKAEFVSCHRLRKRLVEQMQERIEAIQREMLESDATKPNWALDQASKIAEIKATKKIISLLSD